MSVTLLRCCPLCLVLCGRVSTCAGPMAAYETGTQEQLRPKNEELSLFVEYCGGLMCGWPGQ